MQRVGTCSICGGNVMGVRGGWWSVNPPPPDTCSDCGAVAQSDVIPMCPKPKTPRPIPKTVRPIRPIRPIYPNDLPKGPNDFPDGLLDSFRLIGSNKGQVFYGDIL